MEAMKETDDAERSLRLELMRLDCKLKNQDIRLRDQQIAFQPLKSLLVAGGFALAVVVALIFIVI